MILMPPKGPGEVLYYEFNWARRRLVAGEVILDSSWSVEQGSVQIAANPAPSFANGITRVYLEGGEIGETCLVKNTIETSEHPVRDFTGRLHIVAK